MHRGSIPLPYQEDTPVDRSTSYPFTLGSIDIQLGITGPIVGVSDAENIVDTIFGKTMRLVTSDVVPALGSIPEQIETIDGETKAETLLDVEVLGNKLELTIGTTLTVEVSKELVRTWVAKIVTPAFLEFATRVITQTALEGIITDPESIVFKDCPHIPGIAVVIGR